MQRWYDMHTGINMEIYLPSVLIIFYAVSSYRTKEHSDTASIFNILTL